MVLCVRTKKYRMQNGSLRPKKKRNSRTIELNSVAFTLLLAVFSGRCRSLGRQIAACSNKMPTVCFLIIYMDFIQLSSSLILAPIGLAKEGCCNILTFLLSLFFNRTNACAYQLTRLLCNALCMQCALRISDYARYA